MVRKIGLARAFLPVLGLFIIIPACILVYFGPSTQTFLLIVLIFQLYILAIQAYILAIQADIASRQTAIYEYNYQPILDVRTESDEDRVCIILSNFGKYPALNLATGLRDEETEEIIKHYLYIKPKTKSILDKLEKVESLVHLFPEQEILIYPRMSPKDYTKKPITMTIIFGDVLGEVRVIRFIKFPNVEDFGALNPPIDLHPKRQMY